MISKQHRFNHRFAIRAIYKKGRTFRRPHLSIKVASRPSQPWRAAVVVSRRVVKSAVLRNRIRRRVYEQLRLLEPRIQDGYDILVTVFDSKLSQIEAKKLKNDLQSILEEAKVLAKTSQ